MDSLLNSKSIIASFDYGRSSSSVELFVSNKFSTLLGRRPSQIDIFSNGNLKLKLFSRNFKLMNDEPIEKLFT